MRKSLTARRDSRNFVLEIRNARLHPLMHVRFSYLRDPEVNQVVQRGSGGALRAKHETHFIRNSVATGRSRERPVALEPPTCSPSLLFLPLSTLLPKPNHFNLESTLLFLPFRRGGHRRVHINLGRQQRVPVEFYESHARQKLERRCLRPRVAEFISPANRGLLISFLGTWKSFIAMPV